MRTMSVRYAVESPRTRLPARLELRGRAGSLTASVLVVSGNSQLVLDVEEDALVAVEEALADVGPPADVLDREEAGRAGRVELRLDALDNRAVALGGKDLLRLGRVEVVEERLGALGALGRRDDRRRVLDQDRLVGHDVLERLPGLLGEDRLVLVGEHDVALAAGERLQGFTGALVLHGHVLEEELAKVIDGFLVGLALLELRAVGGHDVPLGAARRERVGRDDLDPVLEEVVPGLDVLRVAGANCEDDHGVREDPVVIVLAPVGVDEARLDQRGDVGLKREMDDVGREAFLDSAPLLAGRGVGLLEVPALAFGGVLERRDDLLVGLAGGGVGDERERAAAAAATRGSLVAAAASGCDQEQECCERAESAQKGDASALVCHSFRYPTFSTS